MPQNEAWISHLLSRIENAREGGLLSKNDELDFSRAAIFFTDSHLPEGISPSTPIREVLGGEKGNGWIKRDDFFDEVAEWILKNYSILDEGELICEAGYSQKGDKVLQSRQHIIYRDKPFLYQKLKGASPETLAGLLRMGRSWRLLGIVAEKSGRQEFNDKNMKRHLFLCDAFDGDSILVVHVKRNQPV